MGRRDGGQPPSLPLPSSHSGSPLPPEGALRRPSAAIRVLAHLSASAGLESIARGAGVCFRPAARIWRAAA